MTASSYAASPGSLQPQTKRLGDRALFTVSFAVIPRGVMGDIITSRLPIWDAKRA